MSDCKEWPGFRNRGYGVVWRDGKNRRAHRVAYEDAYGPIPPGMCVMHKCDNPPCVNVDHLALGTHAENMADAARKGRMCSQPGERNPAAKLTDAQRAEIRRRYVPEYRCFSGPRMRSNARELAEEYGVTRHAIRNIIQKND